MGAGADWGGGGGAYPDPPARELGFGDHETGKQVHEAIECTREDGGHHEVGGDGHTGHPIVGEVEQRQEHEQQEPEKLGCSTKDTSLSVNPQYVDCF